MEYRKVTLTCDPKLVGYSIDTNGILYSKFGRPMKPHPNHNGYLIQPFFVNGKMIARSMHQLVARQFIPNPKNKRTVNHINGNKSDNRVENLEWATDSEQMQHASKVLHALNPSNKIPISGISKTSDEIVHFSSINEACIIFGVPHESIKRVLRGKRHSCHGFLWVKSLNNLEETISELKRIKLANKRKSYHIS